MSEDRKLYEEAEREKKLLSALGLCTKAGKVVFGVPMICDALRRGGEKRPFTVFEASGTSENTHKRLSDKCAFYKVKLIRLGCDGEALAAAVGKSGVLGAIGVTDKGMSALAEKYI